jgi:hypothetical protein
MTYEKFQAAVETMIANLTALKSANPEVGGWALRYHDVSLDVCECAAEIGGFDLTFAKLFNREFRDAAVGMMLGRAVA